MGTAAAHIEMILLGASFPLMAAVRFAKEVRTKINVKPLPKCNIRCPLEVVAARAMLASPWFVHSRCKVPCVLVCARSNLCLKASLLKFVLPPRRLVSSKDCLRVVVSSCSAFYAMKMKTCAPSSTRGL